MPAGPLGDLLAEPLVEPPPPRRPSRPKPLEPVGSVDFRGDGPLFHPDLAEESDLAAELELQRQLDAELDIVSYEDEGLFDPPTPVPRDLIDDIEAFKHEVLKDQGGTSAKKPPQRNDEDPTRLRLTKAQEADLPAYLMTVHVYDRDRSRRFVLISGRKYREGDKTRQGMKVERILAEGAVLSYEGNPFFVHR
jgi:general secretion pathway protein B